MSTKPGRKIAKPGHVSQSNQDYAKNNTNNINNNFGGGGGGKVDVDLENQFLPKESEGEGVANGQNCFYPDQASTDNAIHGTRSNNNSRSNSNNSNKQTLSRPKTGKVKKNVSISFNLEGDHKIGDIENGTVQGSDSASDPPAAVVNHFIGGDTESGDEGSKQSGTKKLNPVSEAHKPQTTTAITTNKSTRPKTSKKPVRSSKISQTSRSQSDSPKTSKSDVAQHKTQQSSESLEQAQVSRSGTRESDSGRSGSSSNNDSGDKKVTFGDSTLEKRGPPPAKAAAMLTEAPKTDRSLPASRDLLGVPEVPKTDRSLPNSRERVSQLRGLNQGSNGSLDKTGSPVRDPPSLNRWTDSPRCVDGQGPWKRVPSEPIPPRKEVDAFGDDVMSERFGSTYGDQDYEASGRKFTKKKAGNFGSSTTLSSNTENSEDADDNFNVVLRVRPLNQQEKTRRDKFVADFPGDGQVTVCNSGTNRSFQFNVVFEPDAAQEDVFDNSGIRRLVDSALNGYTCTAFAFGQTGSGKTHTMTGPPAQFHTEGVTPDPQMYGIMQRSFKFLFQQLKKQGVSKTIKASYLEIYNEQVIDLLNNSHRRYLAVRWSKNRGFYVENLFTVECETIDDLMAVLEEGEWRGNQGEGRRREVEEGREYGWRGRRRK